MSESDETGLAAPNGTATGDDAAGGSAAIPVRHVAIGDLEAPPPVVPSPVVPAVEDGHAAYLRRAAEFHRRLRTVTPTAWATWLLVVSNVGVYVAMVVTGTHPLQPNVDDLVAWGADFGPLTVSGQWWRVLTATFLHSGLVHLAFNMWVLFAVGQLVERLFGNVGFLVLYLLAGVSGSLASLWWNPYAVSVGASGAVFGMFGGLLAFVLLQHESIPPRVVAGLKNSTLSFLGFNLIFGAMVPFIDNAAHLGGFVGGFAAGAVLGRPIRADVAHRFALRDLFGLVLGVLVLWGAAPFVATDALREEFADAVRLRPTLEHFDRVYARIYGQPGQPGELDELTNRYSRGELETDVVLNELRLLRRQWRAMIDELESLAHLPAHRRPLVEHLVRFAEKRDDALAARMRVLETNDLSHLADVHAREQEAVVLWQAVLDELAKGHPE